MLIEMTHQRNDLCFVIFKNDTKMICFQDNNVFPKIKTT